ncbi:hypothetical protein [Variovorax sp. JS1663]|uniref:hypothetical protein n=1 Tax=Variovorax sp. JS1663 TaxID=1851577 RepID=UPI000B6F03AB|nr:hypothetical protein [Variovorax sp. JS1663]OUM02568.1 hypothetical protein A8M77_09855 [Variovorax sp. JS1663]
MGPGPAGARVARAALRRCRLTRASNSIGYFLPPNLGGFYGQVQYSQHVSKRTALYAAVARVNNRNDAAYTGSLSSAITTGNAGNGVGFGSGLPRSSTGYDFGIRHTF